MTVAVLIGIMIAIVVGVNLVPVVMETVGNITGNVTGEDPGLSAVIGVLPYIFFAVIILGAVAWLGGSLFDRDKGEKADGKDYEEPKVSWGSLGRDLKSSYTEKFGKNKEFNRDVDKRVKCMRSRLEEGEKAACRQWLKSTANLVGVPWPMPEAAENGKYSTWE